MSTTEFEHAYYNGNYISGILYGTSLSQLDPKQQYLISICSVLDGPTGVELVMYFTAMHRLIRARRRKRLAGSRTFLALFSTALFILVTIDISTNAVWGEEMWITSRDKPGGVPGFLATEISVWYETLSSTSVVVMIFMGDALLVSHFPSFFFFFTTLFTASDSCCFE